MQKIWHSILWKILSCGCFAGINVLVRFLSGGSPLGINQALPIYSIMFFQHIIGLAVMTCLMRRSDGFHIQDFATKQSGLYLIRVLTAALGIGLFYLSLRYIPVTQAIALSVTTPIFTTIGAVVFLKERFDLQRKISVFLSILGTALLVRPDQILHSQAPYSWHMLLPILAALAFTLDKLLTRKLLASNEKPRTLAWYLLAMIAPLSIIPALLYGWVAPTMEHYPWLLMLGILGCAAHYTFNKAYASAEVTTLLPFGAARIILGALISYVAFAEIPKSMELWLGISVILISTILLGINQSTWTRMSRLQFSKEGV